MSECKEPLTLRGQIASKQESVDAKSQHELPLPSATRMNVGKTVAPCLDNVLTDIRTDDAHSKMLLERLAQFDDAIQDERPAIFASNSTCSSKSKLLDIKTDHYTPVAAEIIPSKKNKPPSQERVPPTSTRTLRRARKKKRRGGAKSSSKGKPKASKARKEECVVVSILNWRCNPERVSITSGGTVVFRIDADDGEESHIIACDELGLESEHISAGESITFRLHKIGRYKFRCTIYPFVKFFVSVTPPSNSSRPSSSTTSVRARKFAAKAARVACRSSRVGVIVDRVRFRVAALRAASASRDASRYASDATEYIRKCTSEQKGGGAVGVPSSSSGRRSPGAISGFDVEAALAFLRRRWNEGTGEAGFHSK